MEECGSREVLPAGEEGGKSAAGCGRDRVAEEGWAGVSDAGESGAAGTDAGGVAGAVDREARVSI